MNQLHKQNPELLKNLPGEVLRDYPYQSHFFYYTPQKYMHYLDEGPKNSPYAIVAVHGNPTWSYYFRQVIAAFKEQMRVIVPDHIGMGASSSITEKTYSLETRIEDLTALIDSLKLTESRTKVILLVHDWGGPIGLGTFLLKRPHLLHKVIITNTAAFCSQDIPLRIAACKVPMLGRIMVEQGNLFAYPAVTMAVAKKASRQVKAGLLWPYRRAARRRGVANFVYDIPLNSAHPSYQTLFAISEKLQSLEKMPKLILWGMKDFCFHGGFLKRWGEFFSPQYTRTVKFTQASHYLFEDDWEGCRQEIAAFLASNIPMHHYGEWVK